MKSTIRRFWFTVLCLTIFVFSLILSACGEEIMNPPEDNPPARILTKISVIEAPGKIAYTVGQPFIPAGMVIQATFSDNTTEEIPLKTEGTEGYTYSPSGALSTTDQKITITYQEKTAETPITVSAPAAVVSISVTKAPTKIAYTAAESFNPTGMVVTATYDDQTTGAVAAYSYEPKGALGTNDFVTVTYEGISTRLMLKMPPAPNNFGDAYDSTAGNALINFWNAEKWTLFPDTAGDGLPAIDGGSLNFTGSSRRRFDAFRMEISTGVFDNLAANIGTALDDQVFTYTTALKASGNFSLFFFAAGGATTNLSAEQNQAIKLSLENGKFNLQSLLGGNGNILAVSEGSPTGYQTNEWNRFDFVLSRKNNFVTFKIYINGFRLFFEDTALSLHASASLINGNFVFGAGTTISGSGTADTPYPNYGHRFGVVPATGATVRLCPVDASGTANPTLAAPDAPPVDPNGIYYSAYGAKGDGVTNDAEAIRAAHAAANSANKKVYADWGKTYYIGNLSSSIIIQTNTDWTGAKFTIDDDIIGTSNVGVWIFQVTSKLTTISNLSGVTTLTKGQAKINKSFTHPSLIRVVNNEKKVYIREGLNTNSGSDQSDVFRVDKSGNIDPAAPIIFDYTKITSAAQYPIDATELSITGGEFTTINNQLETNRSYFARGIRIQRSNTVVDGLQHKITKENPHTGTNSGPLNPGIGRAYTGFIQTQYCVDVTIKNCILQGHKWYYNNDNRAQQGTYDFNANNTIGLKIENCSQFNDINNSAYWGLFTSNFSKNITFEKVTWSRFDAHQGVYNVTIKDSSFGHQNLQIVGGGTLYIENTTVRSGSFVNLRTDYGSTWEGDIVIKNCTLDSTSGSPAIIGGSHNGNWDFGYQCYIPNLEIDGMHVKGNIGTGTLYLYSGNWGSNGNPYATIIPTEVKLKNLTRLNGSAANYAVTSSSRFSGLPVTTSW